MGKELYCISCIIHGNNLVVIVRRKKMPLMGCHMTGEVAQSPCKRQTHDTLVVLQARHVGSRTFGVRRLTIR